ncbi:uncharacterized protein DSM5745_08674 [Aspergillus mulundensis]|uniref:Uncharacterized protein n=1 Tax=Aspergillus mulundensis TaxID=1810919 RepID=A0A3D8R526_9EURO|nr:hypothetical protein DSM5745_08674 [Aspergillus mulundensis]RDW68914.1 hypothetical protein DSM5745_08674 [Aspergillus mulundensis]
MSWASLPHAIRCLILKKIALLPGPGHGHQQPSYIKLQKELAGYVSSHALTQHKMCVLLGRAVLSSSLQ